MIDPKSKVSLKKHESYDTNSLIHLLKEQFESIGITPELFKDKNVVIKPNLVRRCDESVGATTHSSFATAAAKLAFEYGAATVTFAESPGGVFSPETIKKSYAVARFDSVAAETGAILSCDTDAVYIDAPEGARSKVFHILKVFEEADVIINLAKLKTHGLTWMSAAVKNYFGVVPGVEKFEMHARFPDKHVFAEMIDDLCYAICHKKETVNVVDGIVGMEGNGPTNGTPRKMGVVVVSQNPFSADVVCSRILGIEKNVHTVNASKERGYTSDDGFEVVGDSISDCILSDVVLPDGLDAIKILSSEKLLKIFKPKPAIDRDVCRRCGECVRSCPMKTITMDKNKKVHISTKNCIRCFCCQELCPFDAVRIKQNPIFKFIK